MQTTTARIHSAASEDSGLESLAEGILLVDKPAGKTSFSLVAVLRKILGVKKIGHAGTLDPFATGVLVMLIGKKYTRLSDQFLCREKSYLAKIFLGKATDTYDCEGKTVFESDKIPTEAELLRALESFQGEVEQIPPMFSAKKQNGKKLYELARQGKEVERKPVKVFLKTTLLEYSFPYATLSIECSKGTYIRSIANDLGSMLGSGAYLTSLKRTKSGSFSLDQCLDGHLITSFSIDKENLKKHLLHLA